MRPLHTRADKLVWLTQIVQGIVTPEQITQLRKSREPMQITFDLGYGDDLPPLDPDEPTYHIEVYSDYTTKQYYRYPDGRIEYRND